MSNRLVYLDFETTGLDEKAGHVLEIGLLAVELPTFNVVAEFSHIVRPPCWDTVKRNLNEVVREMHTENGLIAEIDATDLSTLSGVEQLACSFMQEHSPITVAWRSPVGGRNVPFDRKWGAKHTPKLMQKFHGYRGFDVTAIAYLQDWVFGESRDPAKAPHRSLPDCKDANDSVRRFLGLT